jgi:hypothetical protein
MKLLFHDQSFDKEMLEKIFDAYNSQHKNIHIYLSSDGGSAWILDLMVEIINIDPDRFTLTGYNELSSSAFEFYIKAKCSKELLPGTIGMYHQSTREIHINDKGKPAYNSDAAFLKRKKNIFWPTLMEFIDKCELTKKEKNKIKKGDDVYFQYNRFKEIENAYTKNTRL